MSAATGRVVGCAALEHLAQYALPEDAPGAWIRAAIAELLADEDTTC